MEILIVIAIVVLNVLVIAAVLSIPKLFGMQTAQVKLLVSIARAQGVSETDIYKSCAEVRTDIPDISRN